MNLYPGGNLCPEREGAHGLLCEAKKQLTSDQVQEHCSAKVLGWCPLGDSTGSSLTPEMRGGDGDKVCVSVHRSLPTAMGFLDQHPHLKIPLPSPNEPDAVRPGLGWELHLQSGWCES